MKYLDENVKPILSSMVTAFVAVILTNQSFLNSLWGLAFAIVIIVIVLFATKREKTSIIDLIVTITIGIIFGIAFRFFVNSNF